MTTTEENLPGCTGRCYRNISDRGSATRMQESSHESNLQDLDSGEPVALASRTMDKLALIWSIGIGVRVHISGLIHLLDQVPMFSHLYCIPDRRFSIHRYRTENGSFYQYRIFWHRDNPPENGIYLIPEERVFGSDLPRFSQVNKKNTHIWWFCCVCG